jgi:Flp pilus assembly protein TadG
MARTANKLIQRPAARGALTVELAVVLPVVLLFIWGLFEFARLLLAADTIVSAAQDGCRTGITPGSTSADVTAEINTILSSGFISGATVTITPAEASTLKTGEALTVTIKVPFSQITWLPTPQFLSGKVVKTTCVMLREGK